MDQNNFNGQEMNNIQNNTQSAPVYSNPVQNGNYYGNGAYANQGGQYGNPYAPVQQPVMQQNQHIEGMSIPEVASCVDSAFARTLAATIMGWFPICSIIAIVLACKGLKLVERANYIAAQYGTTAGGKNVAAKVLGIIGKVVGIIYTSIWGVYFLILMIVFFVSLM